MKKKCYDDGGLTFAEMSDEDRASSAKAAIEALNARQAKTSEEAGGASEKKTTSRRAAPKVDAGDTRENLRDLDMQGADTGYDATERTRNAKKTQERHYSGRPFVSAEPKTSKSRSGKLGTQGVYGMKAGGSVSSASRRGDGCAIRGKTKGRMV